MTPIEHLKLIKDNPGAYKFIDDSDLADIILQLLETKSLFKKAKVEIRNGVDGKDGVTPKAGIDYMSRAEQESLLRDLVSKIELPQPTNGKDGKDAQITNEQIQSVIDSVYNAIFPLLPEPMSSEEIRNRLEVLTGDERLTKEAIKGIEEIELAIKELQTRPVGTSFNGIGRGQVQDVVDRAIAAIPATAWGTITGTLSDQTDLVVELDRREILSIAYAVAL